MKIENRPSPYTLRLKSELREKLQGSADEAGRSLQNEILKRLEESYAAQGSMEGGFSLTNVESVSFVTWDSVPLEVAAWIADTMSLDKQSFMTPGSLFIGTTKGESKLSIPLEDLTPEGLKEILSLADESKKESTPS